MKATRIWRIECEGCGATRFVSSDECPTEFGPHGRIQPPGYAPHRVESETECLAYAARIEQAERKRAEECRRRIERLVARCAADEVFRGLLATFPGEDGTGPSREYLERRIKDIAYALEPYMGLDAFIDGRCLAESIGGYYDLVKRCVAEGRAAMRSH